MKQAVVLVSGGVDSAVALFWARGQSQALTALSFDYHLRPLREKRAARELAERAGAQLIEVPVPFVQELSDLRAAGFPVTRAGRDAPEGYVPARNLVFYALATYYAETVGAEAVIGGHLAQDAVAFPDASLDFFMALEELAQRAVIGSPDQPPLRFMLPLATMTKGQVLALARATQTPLELTWSCYDDGERPCAVCVSCTERREAFDAAGMQDTG